MVVKLELIPYVMFCICICYVKYLQCLRWMVVKLCNLCHNYMWIWRVIWETCSLACPSHFFFSCFQHWG